MPFYISRFFKKILYSKNMKIESLEKFVSAEKKVHIMHVVDQY
jgi:hypothetical protein